MGDSQQRLHFYCDRQIYQRHLGEQERQYVLINSREKFHFNIHKEEKKRNERKNRNERREEKRLQSRVSIEYSYLKQLARLEVQLIAPAVSIPSHSASL
jgi:hypothetical protein